MEEHTTDREQRLPFGAVFGWSDEPEEWLLEWNKVVIPLAARVERFGSAEIRFGGRSRGARAAQVEGLPDATSSANSTLPPNIGLQRMGWISEFEMPWYGSPTAEAWIVGCPGYSKTWHIGHC